MLKHETKLIPMINEEERAILKLAGYLWIYEESTKNTQKTKNRRKIKSFFKR